ncbi:MAG: hypothetical protein QOH64_1075 [Acidimicrobiaceae bacterium]
MPDDLMTQVRNLLDEGAVPIALDELRGGRAVEAMRVPRRRTPLLALAAGVVCATAVAFGIAAVTNDNGNHAPHPTAESIGPQAQGIARESCVVRSTGTPGCDATPEQAAPLLGVLPQDPHQIPEGWSVARQDLRIYKLPEPAVNGTVYFQLWVPDGSQQNADGFYDTYIQLRQRPQQPNESEPHTCPGAARQTLSNGSQACFSDRLVQPESSARQLQAEWIHDGIWFVLEGNSVTSAQFESTLNSIG